MRVADLKNRNVVIWGVGREGLSAAKFIRQFIPDMSFTFVQELNVLKRPQIDKTDKFLHGAKEIEPALSKADVVIKSPGVSLYHPLLSNRKKKVTSLLNLWFAEKGALRTILITGTKGKSTTASLIAHLLKSYGIKTCLAGNIGIPVGDINPSDYDVSVIEVSSYQAANFNGMGDLGIVTSLYPEHLDWHGSLEQYYEDKLNLIKHTRKHIINAQVFDEISLKDSLKKSIVVNSRKNFYVADGQIYYLSKKIGIPCNEYLARPHNTINSCMALSAINEMNLNISCAFNALHDFQGLKHRQDELGTKNGVLYVDDSISTTPQSTIAALKYYSNKSTTLILGGFDRGIDFTGLIDFIVSQRSEINVCCIGLSGKRIANLLKLRKFSNIFLFEKLNQAVIYAKEHTPHGGVVLLSPASPSYDQFRDFIERGESFAKSAGFSLIK